MRNFAFYRMPFQKYYTEIEQLIGEPEELLNLSGLNSRSGFVFAPFAPSSDCPVLLLNIDKKEEREIEETDWSKIKAARQSICAERKRYTDDFQVFHDKLLDGVFGKIVLARKSELSIEGQLPVRELFLRACALYPSMFIALVSTAKSGVWLMATPEILLKGDKGRWETIALAGTMKKGSTEWSEKNLREQQLVADYIGKCLDGFSDNIETVGPYTSEAGHLVHLRTDFFFEVKNRNELGSLLDSLHPTPAVCGLPKSESRSFIIDNENCPRRYYSGFAGILNPDSETNLYVSLRCMNINEGQCFLYAGGGLLAESSENQEWEETESKMQTMLRLFE